MEQVQKKNILGTEPIGGLLRQFAVPSIIAMLVGALYNIVDQFFIGRSVGELGNAATNVAFPLTISCVALALLFGIGGAASFNLTLGGGDREKALFYIGNAATLLFGSGVILGTVALFCRRRCCAFSVRRTMCWRMPKRIRVSRLWDFHF